MLVSLWSYRFSVARGWYWVLERECSEHNALEWLKVFQQDEPGVEFKLSHKKPKDNR